MSFYPTKRHLCLPRAVQMRIGGKFAERLDPGAGLLMHNTCAGCHRWTRFIIALRRYCRTLRSAKVDMSAPSATPGRQGVVTPTQPNPIKRTLPDKVVLHQVSLRDDEAIVGFSANDPATHLWCHVAGQRKGAAGRRLKPLSPSTSHPSHCSRKKRSLFLFSTKSRHLFNVSSFQPGRFPCGSGRPGCR